MKKAIFIFTVAGFALRMLVLRMQGTGWLDELFSLHFASMPMGESVRFLVADVHPPLYHVLLTGWVSAFGASLGAARALSFVLGVALVPLVALLAYRVFGDRNAAVIASAITAISPALLYQSSDARMYPLLLVLVTLSCIGYVGIMDAKGDRTMPYVKWAVPTALMLLTQVTAVVPFAVMAGHGILRTAGEKRRRLVSWAAASVTPFVLWFPVLAWHRLGGVSREWMFTPSESYAGPGSIFVSLFSYGAEPFGSLIAFLIIALGCFGALVSLRVHKGGEGVLLGIAAAEKTAVMAATAALPFLLAMPLGVTTIRYYLVALPAAVCLVAGGWAKIAARTGRSRGVVAGIIAVHVLTVFLPVSVFMTERRIRWDDAMRFVEERERPGDLLYLTWFTSELPVRAYYHGSLRPVSGYAYDRTLSFDERLVRHAGQIMTTPEMIRSLTKVTLPSARVFVVGGKLDVDDPVHRWFLEGGWRLSDMYRSNVFSPTVLLFERKAY